MLLLKCKDHIEKVILETVHRTRQMKHRSLLRRKNPSTTMIVYRL